MSQFYDQSSLVFLPSGYKSGKLYSQKPLSTDGELTFTRNSNATRVNADGLVEKVRTNLALYSQALTTPWTNGGGTFTANNQIGPDGVANSASTFTHSNANSRYQTFTGVSGQPYTFSIYVKGDVAHDAFITAGVIGSLTNYNFSVTTEWQRFSMTVTPAATNCVIGIYASNDSTVRTIYVANAQLETGDIATDYIATTSAAVSVGPTANLPRIDYTGSACGKLLLEPQTTALNSYSEQLDNAYWTPANCSVTANQTASPSGYVDAELILDNNSNQQHVIYKSIGITSGNKYTGSFFIKEAGYTTAAVRMGNGALWTGGGGPTVEFDLIALTGTVVDGSGVTYTIEDYGNGWRRCSVTGTCVTSGNTAFSLYLKQYSAYTGNGTSGVYAWGANITATSYLQSYIPTLGASVTRLGDMVGKSAFPTSILNTTTAHSGFFELKPNATETSGFQVFGFDDNTYSSYIKIYADTTGRHRLAAASGGSSGVSAWGVANQYNKFAWSYDGAGNVKFFCNGVASVNYSITLNAMTYFGAGEKSLQTNHTSQSFKQILLFNSKLTDAQLAELTTL